MSTKDRPGTVPVNAYEEENSFTELFNFSQLQDDALPSSFQEENVRRQRSENHEQQTTLQLQKKGEFASVAP